VAKASFLYRSFVRRYRRGFIGFVGMDTSIQVANTDCLYDVFWLESLEVLEDIADGSNGKC
jgi:hypothetical protein